MSAGPYRTPAPTPSSPRRPALAWWQTLLVALFGEWCCAFRWYRAHVGGWWSCATSLDGPRGWVLASKWPVLDHGYIELVEAWGSDERVIESARMSTGSGFRGWGTDAEPGDEKLLGYLWKNQHTTPFEMAGATFEVRAPIFVFREWHRHRTQSFNEASARYMPLPEWLTQLANAYDAAEACYRAGLAAGVPKEVARVVMPVGRYSTMRVSANLLNWLRFLALRCDERAQREIRQYADAAAQMLATKFPRTLHLARGL